MVDDALVSQTGEHVDAVRSVQLLHFYYSAEGFGALYRRSMLNDFFTDLIGATHIRSVAEVPLDSYGIVGAGSLIFAQLGCDLSLVSDRGDILDRAQALMAFNRVEKVAYRQGSLYEIALDDDTFDLTWSFDRVQALSAPDRFLRELCRISKATMVIVPNADNYGQYMHHIYHAVAGNPCEYVGPRSWMRRRPIRDALRRGGMEIIEDGIIDAPWWPGFPELPNLIRGLLGRPAVGTKGKETPEVNPEIVPAEALPELEKRVQRSSFFERGRIWPGFIRVLFSHNLYVLACKPEYRRKLGFYRDADEIGDSA